MSGSPLGSIAIQNKVNQELSLFGEVAYQSLENQRGVDPSLYVDAGGAYKITPKFQIDLYAGVGLSGGASDSFYSAGLSIAFSTLVFSRSARLRYFPNESNKPGSIKRSGRM